MMASVSSAAAERRGGRAARITRSTADKSSASDSASGACGGAGAFGRNARAKRPRRSSPRLSSSSTTSRTCWYSSSRRTSSARGSSNPSSPSGRGSSICALMRSSRAAISRYSAASFNANDRIRCTNCSATRAIGMSYTSSCSSRMSVRSSSNGPENCGSSTENGADAAADGAGANTVIWRMRESGEPLPRARKDVRPDPTDQILADDQGRSKPQIEQAKDQKCDEDHQARRADLLVAHGERARQQILHHVRAVQRRDRNEVERDEQKVDSNPEDEHRLHDGEGWPDRRHRSGEETSRHNHRRARQRDE